MEIDIIFFVISLVFLSIISIRFIGKMIFFKRFDKFFYLIGKLLMMCIFSKKLSVIKVFFKNLSIRIEERDSLVFEIFVFKVMFNILFGL